MKGLRLMKKICNIGANSMIKAERGILYSTVQKDKDDRYLTSFKFFDFITNSAAVITKDVYLLAKFGKNFEEITPKVNDIIHSRSAFLPGSKVFVCERDGRAMIFGADGSLKWKGFVKYKGFGPSDITVDSQFIWCAFPESNAVIKYNTNSMRQDFVIGGSASGGLNEPCGVFHDGERLIVGSLDGTISYINLDDFQIEETHHINEPVMQYTKAYVTEVVLCKSGIYTLE